MSGEMIVAPVRNDRPDDGKFTNYSQLRTVIVTTSAGVMLGYDMGISGGITSMTSFLKKFFPADMERVVSSTNYYCKYNNQKLQAFTSSLYIAGLVVSFVAHFTSRKYGHRLTIRVAATSFVCGTILCASAQSLGMLFFGRILLGIGVGFCNQALPLYLSEIMAFTNMPGDLNFHFHHTVPVGIWLAYFVNYGANKIDGWGWRLALGLAGVPAVLLAIGGLLLPDTPTSLIEQGKLEEGRRALQKLRRGVENVDNEFQNLVAASEVARTAKHPAFRNIIKRRNRPQLVIAMFLQIFRHFTGITAIMFYSPVLFQTFGFDSSYAFSSACIIAGVNAIATVVAKLNIINKVGRRELLLIGGSLMFVTQFATAVILGVQLKTTSTLVEHLIDVFVAVFACTWSPLGWLIPSETFPPETHPAVQSITVPTNLLLTFLIAQSFPSMLCSVEYGIFLFFAGFIVIMTLFAIFFLPQAKGIPIEEIQQIWDNHWYWKRFMPSPEIEGQV